MTLPLSPDMLHGAYEYLRTTPPIRNWRLPEADEIEFRIMRSKAFVGQHQTYTATGRHIISISAAKVGHTTTLMVTMAHEMVHAQQAITKTSTAGVIHNAEFYRLAKLVCKYHGFDPKEF